MSPGAAMLLAPVAFACGLALGAAAQWSRRRLGRAISWVTDIALAGALVAATLLAEGSEYLVLAALVLGLGVWPAVPHLWTRQRDNEHPRPSP